VVFSSVVFLFYFLPPVLILYYTLGRLHTGIQNVLLLIASLLFYAWGEPKNVIWLIASSVLNWGIALILVRWKRYGKLWVAVACGMNLGLLFVYKYWDFAASTVNAILEKEVIPLLGLSLPIGISFFTFQALSYVTDVYRGHAQVQKDPLYVMLYIAMFPKLTAGPIVRYSSIAEQIHSRRHTFGGFSSGCVRFVQGLAKKLLLADTFAVVADTVYGLTEAGHVILKIPVLLAWLGSFAYTLQIFFDFSAYSDMAIGLGQMFGFSFEENFRYPYCSRSMGEFWRRWHISLGTWFKDYVYIPLGGSRVESNTKMLLNLMVVWVLTGLWHGASWNYLIWGILNYVFIAAERLTGFEKSGVRPVWKHLYTMLTVNFGWVLFRCENMYHLREYFGNLLGLHHNGLYSPYVGMFLKEYAVFWLAGILLCMPIDKWMGQRLGKSAVALRSAAYLLGMLALFALSVLYLAKNGCNPFIYFNF